MRTTVPTTALVAVYLALAQTAAAAPDGGSISALLERIASQHHKALPNNAVPSDLRAVTTIADAGAAPTSLPSGAVVLAPKDKSDKSAHKRMAKAVRKRAFEGEEILARAAEHDREQRGAEKRWIRASYIIQDGDVASAVPTDGGNYKMVGSSAVAAGTPVDSVVAPSFPPSQGAAEATDTPAAVNTPHASIALPSFPPRSSATPAPVASVAPAVSSAAKAAVPNVLALASSVQAAAASASSAASAPVAAASVKASSVASSAKAKATPIFGFLHNVVQGIEHDFQKFEVAVGIKKASTASVPAATTSAVAGQKEKRWVWATEIIQDGDVNSALPSDGSNVNLLSNGYAAGTPVNSIVTPTFPPFAQSAVATASNAVPTASATEESTLEAVQVTIEEKLAAIAKGFAEAEAATASTVAGAFSRERREFEIAHRNTKRVEKLVRRHLK